MFASVATVLFTGCPINPPVSGSGTVHVAATRDGSPWTGPVDFTLTGQAAGTSVPASYTGVPTGDYTLSYVAGSPPEAVLSGITPSGSQNLTSGGTITFTLDFRTKEVARSNVVVLATVRQDDEDVSWLGPVDFTLTGPDTFSSSSVPSEFKGMPLGTYTLTYISGGPPGTVLLNITPSSTQGLSAGDTIMFTMQFG
jgi:hypothetical protein